jgi:hypothetical protein
MAFLRAIGYIYPEGASPDELRQWRYNSLKSQLAPDEVQKVELHQAIGVACFIAAMLVGTASALMLARRFPKLSAYASALLSMYIGWCMSVGIGVTGYYFLRMVPDGTPFEYIFVLLEVQTVVFWSGLVGAILAPCLYVAWRLWKRARQRILLSSGADASIVDIQE